MEFVAKATYVGPERGTTGVAALGPDTTLPGFIPCLFYLLDECRPTFLAGKPHDPAAVMPENMLAKEQLPRLHKDPGCGRQGPCLCSLTNILSRYPLSLTAGTFPLFSLLKESWKVVRALKVLGPIYYRQKSC